MRKITPFILTVFLLSSLVSVAWAGDFNMTEVPQNVANYFSVSLFAGELLTSFVFLLFATCMVVFTFRRQTAAAIMYAILVVDFVLMGFLVAMGWLDYWIFLIISLIVAVLMAGQLRDLLTGK